MERHKRRGTTVSHVIDIIDDKMKAILGGCLIIIIIIIIAFL